MKTYITPYGRLSSGGWLEGSRLGLRGGAWLRQVRPGGSSSRVAQRGEAGAACLAARESLRRSCAALAGRVIPRFSPVGRSHSEECSGCKVFLTTPSNSSLKERPVQRGSYARRSPKFSPGLD